LLVYSLGFAAVGVPAKPVARTSGFPLLTPDNRPFSEVSTKLALPCRNADPASVGLGGEIVVFAALHVG